MAVPSNPGWPYGYTPSVGEWANAFSGKVDYPAPVDQGGTGALTAVDANYALSQRAQVITPTLAAAPLTIYDIRTDLGACTVALPAASSCKPGDWIEFLDCGNNAAINNILFNAAGEDQIALFSTSSGSQTINTDSGGAVLVCTGANTWCMWATTAIAPAAGSLDGTETWNAYKNGAPESITTADIVAYVASTSQPIYWAVWFNQAPAANELLALFTVPVNLVFSTNFGGAVAAAPATEPSASFVLAVNHIVAGVSTPVGTITVSTAGAVTFACTAFAAAAGTQLSVTGPATADATITGFAATLNAAQA